MGKHQAEVQHDGVVQAIIDEKVIVKMTVSSACAGCHARHLCSTHETQDKLVEATNIHHLPLQVGDEVIVALQQKLAMKAVVLGFLYPFLLLFIGLITMTQIVNNELIAGIIALTIVAIYYIILWLFRKKISKEYTFVVLLRI